MFLSKKNAIYFNKPKNNDPTKPKRILGGIYFHIHQAGKMITRKNKTKSTTLKSNKSNPNPSVRTSLKETI